MYEDGGGLGGKFPCDNSRCNIGRFEGTERQMLLESHRYHGSVTTTMEHKTEGESMEKYKFKVVSLFNKNILAGLNRDQEMEKLLLDIFRRGLQRMPVQTHIIRQDSATLKEAAQTAISEFSILSSERSHEIMEIHHHRQRINIQVINRNRD